MNEGLFLNANVIKHRIEVCDFRIRVIFINYAAPNNYLFN